LTGSVPRPTKFESLKHPSRYIRRSAL
jgi:hypothetical protein